MAATRLIPMHVNKGKTIAQSLGDRTDYAKNPEKTDKGELVTGYQCDPMTVDEEFMLGTPGNMLCVIADLSAQYLFAEAVKLMPDGFLLRRCKLQEFHPLPKPREAVF